MREFVLHVLTPVAEVDPFGELRPSAQIRLLQLAASEASATLGFDAAWYERRGASWVVRRTRFEQISPARHGDQLRIRTWVSDMRRVRSWRQYEIVRHADGLAIARAATDWVYVDAASGAPTPLPLEVQQAFMPEGIASEERRGRLRLPRDVETTPLALRAVELADLDSLGHVNNSAYADFVQQSLFEDLLRRGWSPDLANPSAGHLRARTLEIEYLTPAQYRQPLAAQVVVARGPDHAVRATVAILAQQRTSVIANATWEWTVGAIPDDLQSALA